MTATAPRVSANSCVTNIALSDRHGRPLALALHDPRRAPRAAVVVMPGAQATAERYAWLGEGLAAAGCRVAVAEAPEVHRTTPFSPDHPQPTRLITIDHLVRTLAYIGPAAATAVPVIAVGHSLGGTVILEALDADEARRNPQADFADASVPVDGLAGAVILGASLQPDVMGMVVRHRSATAPLTKPAHTALLFLSGECDAMIPPAAMAATARRYGAARHEVMAGANHLGWMAGRGPFDRPDLDGKATIPPERQRSLTITRIVAFLDEVAVRPSRRQQP
jgi:alpha-beta hydrolase superfamily lysophospholipase